MKTIALFLLVASVAQAEDLCSPIGFCQVTKQTYGKKGWKTDYVKELKIPKFCYGESLPTLELEPDLGIAPYVFKADKEPKDGVRRAPYVMIDLFTYKLTYVVAKGTAPLTATAFGFEHRLQPKGKSVVDVSCEQR